MHDAATLSYSADTPRDGAKALARTFCLVCLTWGLIGLAEVGLRATSRALLGPDESTGSYAAVDVAIERLLDAGRSVRDATVGPPQILPGPEWAGVLHDPVEWPGAWWVVDALATLVLPLMLALTIASLSRRRWLAGIGRAALLVAAAAVVWHAVGTWCYSTRVWSSNTCFFGSPPNTPERFAIAARLLAIDMPMTAALAVMALAPWRSGWPARVGVAIPLACFAAAGIIDAGALLSEYAYKLEYAIDSVPPASLHAPLSWMLGTDEPDTRFERSRTWFASVTAAGAAVAAIGVIARRPSIRMAGAAGLVPFAALTGFVFLVATIAMRSAVGGTQGAIPSRRFHELASALAQVNDWTPAVGLFALAAMSLLVRRRASLDPAR